MPHQVVVFSIAVSKLQVDGTYESRHPTDDGDQGALWQRPYPDESRDDGTLQRGKNQPAWGLLADRGANSRFHCTLLGLVSLKRNAFCALFVFRQSGGARCLIWHLFWGADRFDADFDGGHDVYPDQAQSNAARSSSGQADDDHADRVFGDVLLLSFGVGSVLACQ